MKKERLARYIAKLELLDERLGDVEEWAFGLSFREFEKDKKTKLATYKAFQEAVEACADICAMMLKDSRVLVKDDYANIDMLVKKKIIPWKLGKALKEANGLRNRLVHEYNDISPNIVFESIKAPVSELRSFHKGVKQWLSSQN